MSMTDLLMQKILSMKNLLLKVSILCACFCALLGCDESNDGVGAFNLEIKNVGADYVELKVTAPHDVEVAYLVAQESRPLTAAVLFANGSTMTVHPGDVVRISENIFQDNDYILYAVAKIDEANYSSILKFQFTTEAYGYTDLLTVVETYMDGYKIHIHVPDSVKQRGNAIRYGSTSLAWYNVLKDNSGSEFTTALTAVVANGNRHGNYVLNDSTMIRNDENVVELDPDGNPILDDYGQQVDIHDPIAPGEPTVFLAGEVKYGSDDEMAEIMGFHFAQADNAYIVPLFDWDTIDRNFDWSNGQQTGWYGSGWVGAFQKLVFEVTPPGMCEELVDIQIPEDLIGVAEATVYFRMDEEADRYFYMILDDTTYKQIVEIFLDGNEKWFQWYLSSYVAAIDWGVQENITSLTVPAGQYFNDGALNGDNLYHVLCNVVVDDEPNDGAYQRYIHKTFKTKPITKKAPIIKVEDMTSEYPFYAKFNVKAPNKDIVGAFWAANYDRDFELLLDNQYTYEDILRLNKPLSAEELAEINSDAGWNVYVPSLDGETIRLAVFGCNDEHTFNDLDRENEGFGWADSTVPMAEEDPYIESPLYEALAGDWTATATMKVNQDGATRDIIHKSKITISRNIPDIPDVVDDYVYDLYKNADVSNVKEYVDGMFKELKERASRFAVSRLEDQNRMLCTGFLDFDYYTEKKRLEYMSPYDLFTSKNYSSVDVAQLIYDFGPKWYLEVLPDGTVIAPFDSDRLPPMHAWPGYSFYLGGYGLDADGEAYSFYSSNKVTKGFPVEVSDDYETITIKPIEQEGGVYYMNSLGVRDPRLSEVEIIAAVVSDIVLTRGWDGDEDEAAAPSSVRPIEAAAVTLDGRPVSALPQKRTIKSLTPLKVRTREEYKLDETPNVVTIEMVDKSVEKILKHFNVK